jgi:protein-S-isoprenylcysteine O-methyltransferase Ste14
LGYHRITDTQAMQMLKRTAQFALMLFGSAAYTGLAVLGWGGFAAFFAHPTLIAMLIPALIARMTAEEHLLHAQFGVAYDAYRDRTAWLLPGVY